MEIYAYTIRYTINYIINDVIYDTEDEKTVTKFLNESTTNKNKIAITTNPDKIIL